MFRIDLLNVVCDALGVRSLRVWIEIWRPVGWIILFTNSTTTKVPAAGCFQELSFKLHVDTLLTLEAIRCLSVLGALCRPFQLPGLMGPFTYYRQGGLRKYHHVLI